MNLPSRALAATLATAALAGALAGCVRLAKPYPHKTFHMIEARREGDARDALTTETLRLRSFRVSPKAEGRGFVYETGPGVYESDFYREFFVAPEPMIREIVREWLRDSGLFADVVDSASYAAGDLVLEAALSDLTGDWRDPKAPTARVEMRFVLLRATSSGVDTLLRIDRSAAAPVDPPDPESLPAAWGRAFAELLAGVEEELAASGLSPP